MGVNTRGTAIGTFVALSKNGVGRASPRNHQLRMLDARLTKSRSDGRGGAFGGSGAMAEPSKMRQSGGPNTSFRERPFASSWMKQWMRPTTGKRGPAVLAIGVRQQSVYQRKTRLEKWRQRKASVPAASFTRPAGIWKISVPPVVSSTSGRSRKRANAWQSWQ